MIEFQPIAIMETPYREPHGDADPTVPRSWRARAVVVFPEFVDGLADLDGFSHLILLTHLHRARPFRLKVVPYLDTVERGLFATRAPSRPNPIGLSVVRLLKVDANRLEVEDIDLLDGTPVLDIKPYVPDFDAPVRFRLGWLEEARRRQSRADDRFETPPG